MSDMRPAMFCTTAKNGVVSCELCPQRCIIPEGATGFCGVRENIGGTLYAMGYGRISALALDPVEKKPLYLFNSGKRVLSAGSFGCNLRCPFCQNCNISMEYKKMWQNAEYCSPEYIAALAQNTVPDGNIGVAYTYNEPLIGYEFLYDCMGLVHGVGLLNTVVTNGYISQAPLEALLPFIDAMNIDLKGFTDSFYKKVSGGIEPVKETIALSHKRCHVEITTLIIPGENDSDEEIAELSAWLASLDPGIPLHLTRFFPRYKYEDKAPTSREAVSKLRDIAGKYLRNVFAGNMD